MRVMKTIQLIPWMALGGLIGLWGPAQAQEPEAGIALDAAEESIDVRTLLIQNGQVYVDGRLVHLPTDINLSGMRQEFLFRGVEAPTVELNGHLFTLEGPQLKPYPLSVGAGRDAVSFRGAQQQGEQMYFEFLQADNEPLFRQLTLEQNLEMDTRKLAARIRLMPNEPQRSGLIRQLTRQLETIFELKQQNRRDEIAQLEAQLEELKKRLQIRENMKDIMIQTRAEALITGKVSLDQQ